VRPLVARAPDDPDGFVRWFEELRQSGPGQGDPLFPWLAQDASREQMRWFLGQEVAGEAGFEDLLALTQLRMPARAKLEMARNYWDEMGRGHAGGVHGGMLDSLATALAVRLPVEQIVWPSLALANLMVSMAWHRHLAFQAVGALGVIELTAPGRAEQVNAGLVRLGVPADARRYFALHATLDVRHSRAWNDEVIRPLVAEDPRRARAIAEGALLRLRAGARCFAAYRRQLIGPR
jgi:pyrroloquinoline quinone (PQQ) biosynthesis protein C